MAIFLYYLFLTSLIHFSLCCFLGITKLIFVNWALNEKFGKWRCIRLPFFFWCTRPASQLTLLETNWFYRSFLDMTFCLHIRYNFCARPTSTAIKKAKWKGDKKHLKTFYYLISSSSTTFGCVSKWRFPPALGCRAYDKLQEQDRDVGYLELHLFSVLWQRHYTAQTQTRDLGEHVIPIALGRMQMGFKLYTAAQKLSGRFPSSNLATSGS